MNCERCRDAISAGEEPRGLAAHVAGCEDCRTWIEALGAVRAHAPALVGAAPDGLTGRVLSHVATHASVVAARPVEAPVGLAASAQDRGWWARAAERWGVPQLVAAGTAAVLVAGVAVAQVVGGTPPGAGPADAVLAAAAYALNSTDASGYRFDVEGQMTATFAFPDLEPPEIAEAPQLPELPGLPVLPSFPDLTVPVPSFSFDCTALPAEVVARCEVEVQRGGEIDTGDVSGWFREQAEQAQRAWEEQREQVRTSINEQLQAARDELARISGEAFTFSEEHEVLRVRYDGTGSSDGRGGVEASLAYTFDSPVASAGTLDVVTVGDVSYVRSPETDGWIRLGGHAGFRFDDLTAPRDPYQLLDDLVDHGGPITELGERDLDGVRVRGLQVVSAGATVTAWIGLDDGHLRELTHVRSIGSDPGTRIESSTTVRIRDVGADIVVTGPATWTDWREVPATRLPPFHTSIELDVRIQG